MTRKKLRWKIEHARTTEDNSVLFSVKFKGHRDRKWNFVYDKNKKYIDTFENAVKTCAFLQDGTKGMYSLNYVTTDGEFRDYHFYAYEIIEGSPLERSFDSWFKYLFTKERMHFDCYEYLGFGKDYYDFIRIANREDCEKSEYDFGIVLEQLYE